MTRPYTRELGLGNRHTRLVSPVQLRQAISMHSLPIFVRLRGRTVILVGEGPAADAKRRLLERAGANVVADGDAALAIVAVDDDDAAEAAVASLKARNILVNAVDRPALCDFTLPAIVDRDPVLIAIGTGGASAGLAKALRQRLEQLLPASLGDLADALYVARERMRKLWPDATERRRAIDAAFSPGEPLDPFRSTHDLDSWLDAPQTRDGAVHTIDLRSHDPDDLTLREARLLASADRVFHDEAVPQAVLNRARADADRICGPATQDEPQLVTIIVRSAAP